jgi:hypothetical protein
VRTGVATYSATISGRPIVRYLAREYLRRFRWSVRILAWVLSAAGASLAGWRYSPVGPVALEAAFFAVVLARYPAAMRQWQRNMQEARSRPEPAASPADDAIRREARRQAALPRVPSPGGWTVPPRVRPAWSWTPAPGITARLDRVRWWVRLWYRTPFVDRYACAWMWHRGGWDAVPPEAWSAPPSS